MAPTVPPPPLGRQTWPWEHPSRQLRPDWQVSLHASRPLTEDELDRLIRLNTALGRAAIVLARPSSWPAVRPPWYNVDLTQSLKRSGLEHLQHVDHLQRPERYPGLQKPSQAWWEGWLPAAALLLTLLLLLARATERCLSNKLKRRRAVLAARSRPRLRPPPADEWPTPNVTATAQADHVIPPPMAPFPPLIVDAPPPPYSEDPPSDPPPLRDVNPLLRPGIDFTQVERSTSTRRSRNRRFTDDPDTFPYNNVEELCRLRNMLKRREQLPPSYNSVVRDLSEVPPYSSVVFNNVDVPSVHFYNQRVDLVDFNTVGVELVNNSGTTGVVSQVIHEYDNATVIYDFDQNPTSAFNRDMANINHDYNNAIAYDVVQNSPPVNQNINQAYNTAITGYDDTLTPHDGAEGSAEALEENNTDKPYEHHFVPEPVASKALAITESMLANSDILKRHRGSYSRYDDVAIRRNLERELEALIDEDTEHDEVVRFGISDEYVNNGVRVREIDEINEMLERDITDETAIDLDNEINAQFENAMDQDNQMNIEAENAIANDFDDDAKQALNFAETQIDDKHIVRA